MKIQDENCIRLYDSFGKHVISVMKCLDDENRIDIANPDGKVLLCKKHDHFMFSAFEECIQEPINN